MIVPMNVEVGKPVTFTGYADDYGNQIVAVEFSLDDGESWHPYDVSTSSPDLMVHWTFTYTPEHEGRYRLLVRCVTEDGKRSPLPDVAEFYAR